MSQLAATPLVATAAQYGGIDLLHDEALLIDAEIVNAVTGNPAPQRRTAPMTGIVRCARPIRGKRRTVAFCPGMSWRATVGLSRPLSPLPQRSAA